MNDQDSKGDVAAGADGAAIFDCRASAAADAHGTVVSPRLEKNGLAAFGGGAVIGALGGLIGLGGAEFRLPLLISLFRFVALEAIILNKVMSIVIVASALPFRARTVPFVAIADHWSVIANLLVGSLIGAWFGPSWAIR